MRRTESFGDLAHCMFVSSYCPRWLAYSLSAIGTSVGMIQLSPDEHRSPLELRNIVQMCSLIQDLVVETC